MGIFEIILLIGCIIIGLAVFDTVIGIIKLAVAIFLIYWLYQFFSPILAAIIL